MMHATFHKDVYKCLNQRGGGKFHEDHRQVCKYSNLVLGYLHGEIGEIVQVTEHMLIMQEALNLIHNTESPHQAPLGTVSGAHREPSGHSTVLK